MDHYTDKLVEIQESLAAQPTAMTPKSSHPDGLSEREIEVLRLVAAGQSNQQIADLLFLSRYTVIRHVSNIFGKTGASNRAEAATYAHRHSLISELPAE